MSDFMTDPCCCDAPAAPAYDVAPELPPVDYVEPVEYVEPVADIAPAPVLEPLPVAEPLPAPAPALAPAPAWDASIIGPATNPAPAPSLGPDPALTMIVQAQAQEMFSDILGQQSAISMIPFAPDGYSADYDSVNDTVGYIRDGDLTQSRPYDDD